MSTTNADISRALEAIASLMELDEAKPFRVRAYRSGSEEIMAHPEPIAEWVAEGRDLTELQGIGKGIAAKVGEIVEVGAQQFIEQLEREHSPGLLDLLRVPGLGPGRVRAIRDGLGLTSIETVRAAAEEGRLRELAGFGEKTEATILRRLRRAMGDEV